MPPPWSATSLRCPPAPRRVPLRPRSSLYPPKSEHSFWNAFESARWSNDACYLTLMRILLAQNSLYYPAHGGGDKSNRLLLEALSARGHECRAVARISVFGAQE